MWKRKEEPLITQYDMVARRVQNAFGQRETITMARGRWDYLYWLDSIGKDIRGWIKKCDMERGEVPLGEALADWIYCEYERREREGLLQPELWRLASEPDA